MSEASFDVTYRVGFSNMNGFFAAWLKKTWFDRTNWKRFGLYAIALALLFGVSCWPIVFSKPANGHASNLAVISQDHYNLLISIVFGVTILALSLIFAAIFVFVLAPALTYATQLLTFAFGPMRKRVNRVSASTAGIDKLTGDRTSQLRWRDVLRVVETKKTILLFTNRNCATIIPKSAFASPADAEAFAAYAKAQWEEAQSIF